MTSVAWPVRRLIWRFAISSTPFRLSLEVYLSGELDLQTAPAVRSELVGLAERTTLDTMTVDLTAVSFADSTGLEPIAEAQALLHDRGKKLRLRGVPRVNGPLIRHMGLARSLNVNEMSDGRPEAPKPAPLRSLPAQRDR